MTQLALIISGLTARFSLMPPTSKRVVLGEGEERLVLLLLPTRYFAGKELLLIVAVISKEKIRSLASLTGKWVSGRCCDLNS
jgi:hypothetical protein